MQMSEAIDKWTKGMIAFRNELQQPSKNAENPFLKNKYVTLEGILNSADEAIKQIGEDNGISYSQDVTSDTENNVILVTTLVSHVSGQYVLYGPFKVPAGSKKDAQAYGSSTTYAKRYALSAALGIASDLDDDAEGSVDHSNKQTQSKSQSNKQTYQKNKQSKPQKISNEDAEKFENQITKISNEVNKNRKELIANTFGYLNKQFNSNIKNFKDVDVKQSEVLIKYLDKAMNVAQENKLNAMEKESNEASA